MGMAASQARYLTLSARKTNTEYEGQQLNQQRLNIANQSADLFNQMLTMSVPTCPDSNDFTKLQYSWSDGINDEVISDFYQISIPNEDYNYVVTSYHYENVYTGQSKRMNAPEIQHSKKNQYTDKPDKEYQVTQSTYHKESLPGAGDDSYTLVVTRNGVESTHVFKRMDKTIDNVEEVDAFTNRTSGVTAGDRATYTSNLPSTASMQYGYPATWRFEDQDIVFKGIKIGRASSNATTGRRWNPSEKMTGETLPPADENMPYQTGDAVVAAGTVFKQIDFDDENDRDKIAQLLAVYGDKYDPSKTYYYAALSAATLNDPPVTVNVTAEGVDTSDGSTVAFEVYELNGQEFYSYNGNYYFSPVADPSNLVNTTDNTQSNYIDPTTLTQLTRTQEYAVDATNSPVTDAAGNIIYAFVCGEDMDNASGSQGDISKVQVRSGDNTAYYTDGTYILTAGELSAIDLTDPSQSNWLNDIFFHREENNPTYSNFEAVGNCQLNAISADTYNSNEDMQIEIQQVIKDMQKNGNNVAFGNLSACFDPTTGEYIGGIYSFKMFDHTYYTTTADLETAVKGAYEDNAIATNGIDAQNKFCYYTSTYINTKIADTKKALMETDGKGRFSSVKFEDDDTVYTLNCETITDEEAYRNAMNQYFYKQEQYDKAVADINAKTEIIQAQDRELQLRLEQLGTEQTALQTEMEACQKVVQKSIESTFKTFGG